MVFINYYIVLYFIIITEGSLVYKQLTYYYNYYSVTSKTCTGCEPKAEVRDIPGEVDMHILYLGKKDAMSFWKACLCLKIVVLSDGNACSKTQLLAMFEKPNRVRPFVHLFF